MAQLHEGVAKVEVFLTPMAAVFEVRENERGRSNVEFQFRTIGVPSDTRNVRLPAGPPMPAFAPPRN